MILKITELDNPKITAKRVNKKKDANFFLTEDDIYCSLPGLVISAGFPGGMKKFVQYITRICSIL